MALGIREGEGILESAPTWFEGEVVLAVLLRAAEITAVRMVLASVDGALFDARGAEGI